ncbi:MAG TPA: antibiotic biosynthesis monooxygenase [Acidobacteriaceae bacterium]|nr:antibiotic biosynthesis monooxygenase [Acidobacteriaceae bacterium]
MNPVTQINTFSIKSDKVDEFFETDRRYVDTIGRPKGLIGSRLYRSADGRSAVRVSQFESAEALNEIRQSESLRRQIERLRPLVESTSASVYEEAYTTGDFA